MEDETACEISLFEPAEREIIEILANARTIAIVGLSAKEGKASNRVARYLIEKGFEVIPVNPTYAEILGLKSYPSLTAVPGKIDIVDIFRRPSDVPEIVDEALEIGVKTIWMQEGIVNNASARKAMDRGVKVVMDRCIMKEHAKIVSSS